MQRKYPNVLGVTLIEVLISLLIIVIASIATLSYFGPTRGYIGRTGNRRAALERTRERLEQLLAVNPTLIKPAVDAGQPPDAQPVYWATCAGTTCSLSAALVAETDVQVENLANMRRETTVQWKDEPSALTPGTPDVLEITVRVWYLPGTVADDDFSRVILKSLRTP